MKCFSKIFDLSVLTAKKKPSMTVISGMVSVVSGDMCSS